LGERRRGVVWAFLAGSAMASVSFSSLLFLCVRVFGWGFGSGSGTYVAGPVMIVVLQGLDSCDWRCEKRGGDLGGGEKGF